MPSWPSAVAPNRTVLELRRECFPALTRDDVGFVEELRGEPVGYCGVVLVSVDIPPWVALPIAGLSGLCVTHDLRGQGIGSRLVAQAERWAAEHECLFTALFSATPDFYERLGYRVVPVDAPSNAPFLVKKIGSVSWPLQAIRLKEAW